MPQLDPKNLSAQLRYRAAGNPPVSRPSAAISNCFPGLEFDLRNLWRRVFVGLVLHEADTLVVDVEPDAPPQVKAVQGLALVSVNGVAVNVPVTGPKAANGMPETLVQATAMEWGNALAHVVSKPGTAARCVFQARNDDGTQFVGPATTLDLIIRPLLDGPVISRDAVQPGELTQSLCSPWQNDYRECGCYYWAASRPDYVNVDDATDTGDNWLTKGRGGGGAKDYFANNQVTYVELFVAWADHLRFIENGNDKAAE